MEAAAKVRAERRANGEKLKAERDSERQATTAEEHQRMIQRLQALQYNPFDPRTEVSADAQHIAGRIVTHMWIIFVLLPVVLAILWAVLK
jgi:hypothetical protein